MFEVTAKKHRRKYPQKRFIKLKIIALAANKEGLISLAKQMLYFALNDLPKGSHVHFDSFFTGQTDIEHELVIEKINEEINNV